jgi:hypothetical protein
MCGPLFTILIDNLDVFNMLFRWSKTCIQRVVFRTCLKYLCLTSWYARMCMRDLRGETLLIFWLYWNDAFTYKSKLSFSLGGYLLVHVLAPFVACYLCQRVHGVSALLYLNPNSYKKQPNSWRAEWGLLQKGLGREFFYLLTKPVPIACGTWRLKVCKIKTHNNLINMMTKPVSIAKV